jgi:hypothetical protein
MILKALVRAVPLGVAACVSFAPPGTDPHPLETGLQRLEQMYADARDLHAQVELAADRGTTSGTHGMTVGAMRGTYATLREKVLDDAAGLDVAALGDEDRRALSVMRATLERETAASLPTAEPPPAACEAGAVDIAMDRTTLAERTYACFGHVAGHLVVGGDTTDRLGVLGRLATANTSDARRMLFLAMSPIWSVVNADNGASTSPYRRLMTLTAAEWASHGSSIDDAATALGFDPARTESTYVQLLRAWRDRTPTTRIEPWDWWYVNGEVGRRFASRLPPDALRSVSDRFHHDLGADPVTIGVRYDLEPRDGKSPVAVTEFGRIPRRARGTAGGGEAWVVATYRTGGLDNLVELLHETGHAVHILAIDTRPAFADWPDSDVLTEALADITAWEAYEPEWQRRYLGDSASTAANRRARLAPVMLDVAWALFERRMLAKPTRDPNATWTEITSDYLHIAPHPELSWWAIRGQLFDAPGYMSNYALGAMVTAQLRERIRAARGPLSRPDRGTYRWLSARLYRWGLQRPARDVITDFAGAPVSAEALVRSMAGIQ